jgi:ribosomal protein L35AE/L33A
MDARPRRPIVWMHLDDVPTMCIDASEVAAFHVIEGNIIQVHYRSGGVVRQSFQSKDIADAFVKELFKAMKGE